MNRRTKVIIAVVLCIIPLVTVYLVWSQPSVIFYEPFEDTGIRFAEVTFEVEIGPPYTQMQVHIEVDTYAGGPLAGGFQIFDPSNTTVQQITITEEGNYTSIWFDAQGVVTIYIYSMGIIFTIIEGHITVNGRGPIYQFIYGG